MSCRRRGPCDKQRDEQLVDGEPGAVEQSHTHTPALVEGTVARLPPFPICLLPLLSPSSLLSFPPSL